MYSCMYTYMQVYLCVCMCTCVQRPEVIYLCHSPLYFLDYIYLCVLMYTRVCMPQWTCGGQRTSCGNQSSPLPQRSCQGLNSGCHGAPLSTKPSYWHAILLFETRCITKLRTHWFTLLGGQKASEIYFCPMSPSAGITHTCSHAWLLHWCLELKLRSACLYFTDGTIFLPNAATSLHYVFFKDVISFYK